MYAAVRLLRARIQALANLTWNYPGFPLKDLAAKPGRD